MDSPPDKAEVAGAAPRWLLVAGLATGALLAAAGLRAGPDAALPAGAVARVNDQLILRDAWLRAVASVAADRRTPLTADDQRHILDRLVDEELLVQHGVALGLVERDARLRSTLVAQVLQAAGSAAREAPDEGALRQFYETEQGFFAPAQQLRVRAFRLDAAGAPQPFAPAVPDTLLPVAKLRQYLGPALTERARAMQPGEIAIADGIRLELLEAQAGAAPPFEAIREQARLELQRRADEAAVRALLAELRERNEVVVAAAP
jgi:hypothetical protein